MKYTHMHIKKVLVSLYLSQRLRRGICCLMTKVSTYHKDVETLNEFNGITSKYKKRNI